MKKQYLGDSKDSFKWDFHDYLTTTLGFTSLKIVPMLTEDDETNQGNTHPALYPARTEVLSFCNDLRSDRSLHKLRELPSRTKASYDVAIHKPEEVFTHRGRFGYFQGLELHEKEICFFDPDIGFAPKGATEAHVLYSEVTELLGRSHQESVVSVFQNFRRVPFAEDYQCIRQNLAEVQTVGIFWKQLMFVLMTKDAASVERVRMAVSNYATDKPLTVL